LVRRATSKSNPTKGRRLRIPGWESLPRLRRSTTPRTCGPTTDDAGQRHRTVGRPGRSSRWAPTSPSALRRRRRIVCPLCRSIEVGEPIEGVCVDRAGIWIAARGSWCAPSGGGRPGGDWRTTGCRPTVGGAALVEVSPRAAGTPGLHRHPQPVTGRPSHSSDSRSALGPIPESVGDGRH
jgi:hypothetical protein